MSDKQRMTVHEAIDFVKQMSPSTRTNFARRHKFREASVEMPYQASWTTWLKLRRAHRAR